MRKRRAVVVGRCQTKSNNGKDPVVSTRRKKPRIPATPKATRAAAANNKCSDDTLFLNCLDLVLEAGYLPLSDLAKMMTVSKIVSASVEDSHGAWTPFLVVDPNNGRMDKLGLAPPFGYFSKNNNVCHGNTAVTRLHLPPRPRGPQRDTFSYYPHDSENPETVQGLVLARQTISGNDSSLYRFDKNTGALEDAFCPAAEDPHSPLFRTTIYIRRELPITCRKCRVTCRSYSTLVEHCMSYKHQQAVVPKEARIPKHFWDPRNQTKFVQMTPYQRVKACLQYKQRVIQKLLLMDEAGIRKMREYTRHFRTDMTTRAREACTAERVKEFMVHYAIRDFSEHGMALHGDCRSIISQGWGKFQFQDLAGYRQVFRHLNRRVTSGRRAREGPWDITNAGYH
ncbi:expressed unknown protein [Seminavis robusta]|uniref:Uncharacterized protein n=1 Tax=Seminavis robusta TaxID=568900 RepID=A0A9N8E599_9STRA|nr:expressed unknown protein [Seminavis robusta]|eukprot:Sro514_g158030.1 n/a (396) ;mRNA; r:22740-23927